MELLTFKTLWGHPDTGCPESLERACSLAVEHGFDGVEGQIPQDRRLRESFAVALEARGLKYIAEICTAGRYVPDRTATPDCHLQELEQQIARLQPFQPLLVNCIGGCDRWDVQTSCEFFQRALEIADKYSVDISFETHRGRSLYSPWVAEKILEKMTLPLTCDFSHWCVVCEGLGESEGELIQFVAGHARHVHGRVGYDQGPQIPVPENPRYRKDINKHLRWWRRIWEIQKNRDEIFSTLTPEFGPDGYQMIHPDSDNPVGNLNEINRWMADRCRAEFNQCITGPNTMEYRVREGESK